MPVKVNINVDWNKLREEAIKAIDARVIYAFMNACEDAVNYAKTNHEYKQQSGALNSSTGFQIYKDGELIHSYFEMSQGGEKPSESAKLAGMEAGQKMAEKRASELGAHICGVVVAGMPYAIYVEAGHSVKKKDGTKVWVHGRDVLAGAYHQFPDFLEECMREAFKNDSTTWNISND